MTEFGRTVVFGAAGQLGGPMVEFLKSRVPSPTEVIGLTRQDLDVTRLDALERTIRESAPAIVVNCTAYNDVDGAEDDAGAALAVNAFAVRAMARAAARAGSTFVHYSTDFVFTGDSSQPYTEEDRPGPLSVYGASKLLGEWFAAESPRHYILRLTSLFGGSQARSTIDTILARLETRNPVRVFEDRTASPSYVEDVVAATGALLATEAPAGVYHCGSGGQANWYEIGHWLATQIGADAELLIRASASDVKMRAPRPLYCALSSGRLARVGYRMPHWQDAAGRYLKQRGARGGVVASSASFP